MATISEKKWLIQRDDFVQTVTNFLTDKWNWVKVEPSERTSGEMVAGDSFYVDFYASEKLFIRVALTRSDSTNESYYFTLSAQNSYGDTNNIARLTSVNMGRAVGIQFTAATNCFGISAGYTSSISIGETSPDVDKIKGVFAKNSEGESILVGCYNTLSQDTTWTIITEEHKDVLETFRVSYNVSTSGAQLVPLTTADGKSYDGAFYSIRSVLTDEHVKQFMLNDKKYIGNKHFALADE